MSLEALEKKLENLRGTYMFDFTNEDDCAYFFKEYGGEERLKKEYPLLYESVLSTRRNMLEKNEEVGAEGKDICTGSLSKPYVESLDCLSVKENTEDPYIILKSDLNCKFIDSYKEVNSKEPAAPWKGVTIQTKIKEKYASRPLINISKVVLATNNYVGIVKSEPVKKSVINNKRFVTTVNVVGKDPEGNLQSGIFQNEVDIGNVVYYTIKNIKITDPAPKTDSHIASNTIMMLYGRTDQQEIFKEADYSGGDYLKNVFDRTAGKVHLLLPMTGEITFEDGVEVSQDTILHYSEAEKFTRSNASYEYKERDFTYRIDIKEDKSLYNKLKDKFILDTSTLETTLKFDISIDKNKDGRSKYDWYCDVRGKADGQPKTIFLEGAFTIALKNQLGTDVTEQISIDSIEKEELEKMNRKYYQYVKGTNTVYIPPITIYWGCFGKEVRIGLADGTEKRAYEIEIGDKVLGKDGEVLTVNDVITGHDQSIFLIKTADHGEIQVSGGHPMLCDGENIRAAALECGDRLTLVEGGTAEIVSIEQVPYDNTVYNFTFEGIEEGKYIIANGFWAGDLYMQNTKEEIPEPVISEEDKAFAEEMERLMAEMGR